MKKLTISLNKNTDKERLKTTLQNYIKLGLQEPSIYMLMFTTLAFIKDESYLKHKKKSSTNNPFCPRSCG